MVLDSPEQSTPGRVPLRRLVLLGIASALIVAGTLVVTLRWWEKPSHQHGPTTPTATKPAPPSAAPSPEPTPSPAPPPHNLPVIDYSRPPAGFPADPTPLSTQRLGEGLHPTSRLAAYDSPGGRPLAFLAPAVRGVKLTMPIVERRVGWTAVLLPSTNRTMAWVPPGSWTSVPLHNQLIVVRKTHRLIWLRDSTPVRSWPVSLGLARTPTPLGRTFVLGRSALPGRVYGGADVLALGAVPDNPKDVPAGLRLAHTGIHTWYHDRELGKNTTDGCIRLTKTGQVQLLAEIPAGTEVVIIDEVPPADAKTLQTT